MVFISALADIRFVWTLTLAGQNLVAHNSTTYVHYLGEPGSLALGLKLIPHNSQQSSCVPGWFVAKVKR